MDARRKLPRHVGTVWRGVKGVDLRDKYLKGSEVYWWAFSSTTKDLSTLQNPNFLGTSGVRTVFNIQVKRMKQGSFASIVGLVCLYRRPRLPL